MRSGMANPARRGRISDQIQRDLAELIRTEVKDPRVGMVTLTEVVLSPDQRHARIFFTVLGDEAEAKLAEEGLAHAARYLRARLAEAIKLRILPELQFVYDESVERGVRLSKLIDEAVGKTSKQKS
jgi:ribosome-binding factor A